METEDHITQDREHMLDRLPSIARRAGELAAGLYFASKGVDSLAHLNAPTGVVSFLQTVINSHGITAGYNILRGR